LSSAEEKRMWIEALHEQNLEQERLFQLIASLANLLDKDIVVETMQSILGIEPVEMDDCVLFENLAVKFDENGRVAGIYRTIDGTAKSSEVTIQSIKDNGKGL
jgi:hypothetical protein